MWVSFALYNDDGTPRTSATPSFIAYVDSVGSSRSQPTIFNRGGGVYGFTASDSDVSVGTLFHVIDSSGPTSHYVAGVVGNHLYGFAVYDNTGVPLDSATPSFATYIDSLGVAISPTPSIVHVGSGLYGFISTVDAGSFEISNGAGANPLRESGTLEPSSISIGSVDLVPVSDTVIETIRAELLANSGVTALIVDRIFPQYIPQDAAKPCLVLSVITEIPFSTFDGSVATRLRQARLQVDAYATTYLKARQVAAAAQAVIANLSRPDLSATCDTMQDLYEDETQLHRVSADYIVMM